MLHGTMPGIFADPSMASLEGKFVGKYTVRPIAAVLGMKTCPTRTCFSEKTFDS